MGMTLSELNKIVKNIKIILPTRYDSLLIRKPLLISKLMFRQDSLLIEMCK
jgi:hypothetical protein